MNKKRTRILWLLGASVLLSVIIVLLANMMSGGTAPRARDRATAPPKSTRPADAHPFSGSVNGGLMWEGSPPFQELCKQHGAVIRMGAFRTVLPNPLPGEEYNVALGADMLAGRVLQPGQAFSLNQALGARNRSRGFQEGPAYSGGQVIRVIGGGICKIATTLYNVSVLADVEIVQRRAHSMLVPYVPPGQDATISSGLDFVFRNNTDKPIVLWADTKGRTLFMAMYGGRVPPKVKWHHEVIDRQETWTVYQYNPKLKPGEEKEIVEGAEGVVVKSWLTLEYPGGKVETRQLGIDHYRPMPRVVERGPKV